MDVKLNKVRELFPPSIEVKHVGQHYPYLSVVVPIGLERFTPYGEVITYGSIGERLSKVYQHVYAVYNYRVRKVVLDNKIEWRYNAY